MKAAPPIPPLPASKRGSEGISKSKWPPVLLFVIFIYGITTIQHKVCEEAIKATKGVESFEKILRALRVLVVKKMSLAAASTPLWWRQDK
jgi:hypothetical protein